MPNWNKCENHSRIHIHISKFKTKTASYMWHTSSSVSFFFSTDAKGNFTIEGYIKGNKAQRKEGAMGRLNLEFILVSRRGKPQNF